MKLTVKLPDGCPIGAKPERRTLGEFQLVPRGAEPLHTFELPETSVTLDSDATLIIQAHYVPANHSFSLMARYRTSSEDTHVLAAVAECHSIPASLVFQLPNRQFVEMYLQREKTDD